MIPRRIFFEANVVDIRFDESLRPENAAARTPRIAILLAAIDVTVILVAEDEFRKTNVPTCGA